LELLADRSTNQYQLSGNLSWEAADIWENKKNKRATNATYLQTTAVSGARKTVTKTPTTSCHGMHG
jgi:hypothetical protein